MVFTHGVVIVRKSVYIHTLALSTAEGERRVRLEVNLWLAVVKEGRGEAVGRDRMVATRNIKKNNNLCLLYTIITKCYY